MSEKILTDVLNKSSNITYHGSQQLYAVTDVFESGKNKFKDELARRNSGNTCQWKKILSKEIFEKMSDQGAAQVLRSILLADRNNVIDWNVAFLYIQKYMPELKMFD